MLPLRAYDTLGFDVFDRDNSGIFPKEGAYGTLGLIDGVITEQKFGTEDTEFDKLGIMVSLGAKDTLGIHVVW